MSSPSEDRDFDEERWDRLTTIPESMQDEDVLQRGGRDYEKESPSGSKHDQDVKEPWS